MSKTYVAPYLTFGGRCEEAVEFYQRVVGAKVEMLMHFRDSPEPMPGGDQIPGFEDRVMHTTLRIGGTAVMASDGCDNSSEFKGFALSYCAPSEDEARRVFEALGDGGQVTMPLNKTFWSPCFGMLKDRFGVDWMVNVDVESDGSEAHG